jgi:hypothetical protein
MKSDDGCEIRPAAYQQVFSATVDSDDLAESYDELAYERAHADAKTLVIRLDRVVQPAVQEEDQALTNGAHVARVP